MPDETPITAEIMAPVLMLEAIGEKIEILAEATPENNGVMRVRVPWYVSNSVARIAGFDKKIYFGGGILAETTDEGNRTIEAKSPGMTSYARHAHAVTKTELPAGNVVALEHDGTKGHAIIEVNATRWGQDIQALARADQLRATSLRSGRFQVVERKVNGEVMLEATSLALDGIDFAPDGAAMPTYGVEVLAAEAAVEPAPTIPSRRNHSMDEITVDGLRAESPQVVKEIEAPLQAQITELQGKLDSRIQAEADRKRDALLAEIATKTGKPLTEVTELFADAKTDAEVATRALPLLLEGLTSEPEAPKPTAEDRLREMFKTSGRSQAIQAEVPTEEGPNIDGFAVPSN